MAGVANPLSVLTPSQHPAASKQGIRPAFPGFLSRFRRSLPLAAPLLFLAAVTAVFFWPVLFGGKVLLPIDALYTAPPWSAFAADHGVGVPHNELIADMIVQNYSWKSFAREVIAQHQLPLWNPMNFAGVPFLAAGQYGVLYPLGVIFLVLPVATAYGWFTALHVFLAGAFTYLFLRTIGATRAGAVTGAIAFMFCGFLTVSYLWPMIVSTAIWLPLCLTAIERIIQAIELPSGTPQRQQRALIWWIVGAAAVGMQFLAGHLEISFYVLFSMAFYGVARGLWSPGGGLRRPTAVALTGGLLATMVAAGFGLGAAQLAPFMELIRENFRAGFVSYAEVISYALPRNQLFAFLMPDFFGNPTHHEYLDWLSGQMKPFAGSLDAAGNPRSYPFWGIKNYVEGAAYVGVLPLLLTPISWLRSRDRYTVIFSAFALFALLLAFGSPLYALVWRIPGVDQLHTPFRWIFPYSFAIAVLTGLGASALTKATGTGALKELRARQTARTALGRGRHLARSLLRPSSLPVAAGLLILAALFVSRIWIDRALELTRALMERSTLLPKAFPDPTAFYSYEARNLALLALLLVTGGMVIRWATRVGPRWAGRIAPVWFLPLLLAADLFWFGHDFNTASDAALLAFQPPALKFLAEQARPFRTVTFNYDDTLRPNTWQLAGIEDIRGYDTVILKQFVDYWSLIETPQGLPYSMLNKLVEAPSLQSPLLDLLNVRYVMTTQNIGLADLTQVYRGEVNIYRREKALPRAFVVYDTVQVADASAALARLSAKGFDPAHTVVIEGEAPPLTSASSPAVQWISAPPNEVQLQVDMPAEGYLVLTDSYFNGWRAQDGLTDLPILRADRIFRAVRLGAGPHTVRFRYFPDSFRLGLYACLLAAMGLVLAGGYGVWRRYEHVLQGASTVQRVAVNSLTPMLAQFVNKGMDFALAVFIARSLGPNNAGKYAFAVVLITYFMLFTDFGLATLLTREVARNPAQRWRYFANSLMVRLVLSLLSLPVLAAITAVYAWRGGLSGDTATAVALFSVALFPNAVSASLSSLFFAGERMEVPAAIGVATNLLRVALAVAALVAGLSFIGLAGVSIVTNVFTALLFLVAVLRTFGRPAFGASVPFQRQLIVTAFPLMINNFLSTLFFRIDVLLLQPIRGSESVGFYSTAYKFIDGLNFIPSFFTIALFPVMSRYAETAGDALQRSYEIGLKVLLLVSIPISVGACLLADQIILLFFGPEFAPSILALRILIWFLPFSYVNSITHYVLIAVNQQRFLTLAFLIGAGFNILGNLFAISIWGLAGAAVMTVASEIVLLVPFLYGIHKHVGAFPGLRLSVRPLLAAAAMGLTLYLLRTWSMFALVPLGALVYGVALLALGTFGSEDVQLVRRLVRR